MSLMIHVFFSGKNGAARMFAEELEASGTAGQVRGEDGNLQYAYFFPMNDPETVLLIESWRDQASLDAHHKSPMMAVIAALRAKHDLQMRTERFVSAEEVPS